MSFQRYPKYKDSGVAKLAELRSQDLCCFHGPRAERGAHISHHRDWESHWSVTLHRHFDIYAPDRNARNVRLPQILPTFVVNIPVRNPEAA